MTDLTPIVQKNGKGYIFTISKLGSIVAIIVGLITIVTSLFMPYKIFTEFKNESQTDRENIREKVAVTDSVASLSLRYAVENNWNMRMYFENGQPKNYEWKSYEEITHKFYPIK